MNKRKSRKDETERANAEFGAEDFDESALLCLALVAREKGVYELPELEAMGRSDTIEREVPALLATLPPADKARLIAAQAKTMEDPAEEANYIEAALAVDPDCVEARIEAASLLIDDTEEAIDFLTHTVELARRPFLTTTRGPVRQIFKDLHESALRNALLTLAMTEQDGGYFSEAAETLLELRDAGGNDARRIETMRLACLLATGDNDHLEEARAILAAGSVACCSGWPLPGRCSSCGSPRRFPSRPASRSSSTCRRATPPGRRRRACRARRE